MKKRTTPKNGIETARYLPMTQIIMMLMKTSMKPAE
jgi:hypothetical protein